MALSPLKPLLSPNPHHHPPPDGMMMMMRVKPSLIMNLLTPFPCPHYSNTQNLFSSVIIIWRHEKEDWGLLHWNGNGSMDSKKPEAWLPSFLLSSEQLSWWMNWKIVAVSCTTVLPVCFFKKSSPNLESFPKYSEPNHGPIFKARSLRGSSRWEQMKLKVHILSMSHLASKCIHHVPKQWTLSVPCSILSWTEIYYATGVGREWNDDSITHLKLAETERDRQSWWMEINDHLGFGSGNSSIFRSQW